MRSAPTATLVIVGNSPGEVAGWAMPIAAEARRRAAAQHRPLEIALCLPPCQFASGQEQAWAAAAEVFDRITEPRTTLRLALGLPGWAPAAAPVLLHVGGEFWYTRRLARRWRGRAFAFVERTHVGRVHGVFERIFVPTRALADQLASRGVPPAKVVVTGDPRFDALQERAAAPAASASANGTGPTVTFLAGSRDAVFRSVFPFWVQTASAMRARMPDARLVIVISPFVSPRMHRGLVARHRATLEADAITVDYGGWPSITGSDLVLTLPGTNTLELAIKRVPALVVLPYAQAMMARTPMEGTLGVIARTPRLGPALARWAFELQQKRQPFVALPNIRARRRLLPELIGDLTPGQVAEEGARLLRDEGARRRIIQELTAIPDEAGASRRILDAIEPFGAAP